jgi:hypothetical protein
MATERALRRSEDYFFTSIVDVESRIGKAMNAGNYY